VINEDIKVSFAEVAGKWEDMRNWVSVSQPVCHIRRQQRTIFALREGWLAVAQERKGGFNLN